MSLLSSTKSFLETYRDDRSLARLGAPAGSLLRLHYSGRWAARQGKQPGLQSIKLQVHGRPVTVELSPSYEGAFRGVFIDDEYRCADHLPQRPQRIMDLGANIGMGAIYMACQFPGAEFICVEPDPRNLPLLERNLRANSVNAKVVSAAIGPAQGHLNLRFGDDPTCSALESSPMHQLSDTVSVKIQTIPALLEESGWPEIDLLKIDIEGTEDDLLARHNEWLGRVKAIIMEIHPNTSRERLNGFVAPFGFDLKRIGDGREPVFIAVR